MILLISYIPFCIALAWLNYYLIEVKDKRIYHSINGAIHILAAAAGWYLFSWEVGVAILFIARLFFDVSLNLFRGKPVDYVSPSPKSIVDKLEKKIFGQDGITPKIIYTICLIVLILVIW